MSLKLNSSGGGSVTLQEPSTASNLTLTLPDATGTVQVSGNPISGTTGSFSGNLSFNSGYGSAAVAYGCRAWVNFNGTGTVAIRASGNVSSITDNNTGDYTINFSTAMPDADYSPVGSSVVSLSQTVLTGFIPAAFATGSFRFNCEQEGGSRADTAYNLVSIFR